MMVIWCPGRQESEELSSACERLCIVSAEWVDAEWLAFDLETTGIEEQTDVPVSFALVAMRAGEVLSSRSALVDPGREIPEGATAVHGITTEQARAGGMDLATAVEEIATTLVVASQRDIPVVGFNVSYDLTMIDACCRRLDGRGLVERGWAGPVLDPLVMDKHLVKRRSGKGSRTLGALCGVYGVINEAAHDAQGDAVAAGLLLKAYADSFREIGETSLEDLYRFESSWHKSWAGEFSDYLMRHGNEGFSDEEFEWPLKVLAPDTLF